jgi:hypothetical protein
MSGDTEVVAFRDLVYGLTLNIFFTRQGNDVAKVRVLITAT